MSEPMTDLLTRLESGGGSDRELDGEVWCKTCGYEFVKWDGAGVVYRDPTVKWDQGIRHQDRARIPAHTSSLDAALSLVERMLPGWDWSVRHATSADGDVKYGNAQIWRSCDPRDHAAPRYWANHDQPVRALLIALLRALDQEPQA